MNNKQKERINAIAKHLQSERIDMSQVLKDVIDRQRQIGVTMHTVGNLINKPLVLPTAYNTNIVHEQYLKQVHVQSFMKHILIESDKAIKMANAAASTNA